MIIGFFISLLLLILPVAIVIAVISAIVKYSKSTTENNQADFEKIIRSIYVYFLLICSLCAMIGGTIFLFNSTFDYLFPENTYMNLYKKQRNNETIVDMITASSILVCTIPLFMYYSILAKTETKEKDDKK